MSGAMPSDVQAGNPSETALPSRSVPQQTTFREYLESLLVTILIVLYGTTFVVQTFKIPSPSMERTLLVGDYLLVNKFIFEGRGAWYEHLLPYRAIRRGDIIVFKFPYDDHPHYVKRVIGLSGDRVRIVDAKVYVNGALLNEPYVRHDSAAADLFGDDFPPTSHDFLEGRLRPEWAADILNHVVEGELVVPPDEYFAMGDNRDYSWDCRYWGFVRRDAIMGRPVIIYWSVEANSGDYANDDFISGVRGMVRTLLHLPSRARWGRMLHEVH
ncbi:MAG: signal peptidase I [Candidatus Acidiferrales bacterium]